MSLSHGHNQLYAQSSNREVRINPGNYRGISITTTMYKIFSSIINNISYHWTEKHHKIDEAQSGFRRNYSTADNIYSLQGVIHKYLSKQGGRKAFDKINHNKLFDRL